MSNDIEEILEDLSYSMASPEAQDFHRQIINKDYDAAKEILREHISDDKIEMVIDYFVSQHDTKIRLEEFKIENLPMVEDDTEYLIKVGSGLYHSKLYFWRENYPTFYAGNEQQPPKNVSQIWKIVKE